MLLERDKEKRKKKKEKKTFYRLKTAYISIIK